MPILENRVAPYTGAWIEIKRKIVVRQAVSESLPTRERGLKSDTLEALGGELESLPTRERGLKFRYDDGPQKGQSRSLHGSVD